MVLAREEQISHSLKANLSQSPRLATTTTGIPDLSRLSGDDVYTPRQLAKAVYTTMCLSVVSCGLCSQALADLKSYNSMIAFQAVSMLFVSVSPAQLLTRQCRQASDFSGKYSRSHKSHVSGDSASQWGEERYGLTLCLAI